MTSEVRLDTAFGLYSGGRRPAFKPQHMAPVDALLARKEAPVMLVKVEVSAPCEDCLHAVVCGRRDSITALNQGDLAVNHSPLRGGLTLVLSARVDCDAYLPAEEPRSAKAPTAVPEPLPEPLPEPVHELFVPDDPPPSEAIETVAAKPPRGGVWTPERRAAHAERMRGVNNFAGHNAARHAPEALG
jgi:hypothetical protein